jgi:hypothetical protein
VIELLVPKCGNVSFDSESYGLLNGLWWGNAGLRRKTGGVIARLEHCFDFRRICTVLVDATSAGLTLSQKVAS